MKISELMIGDYICLDGDVYYDDPIQVQQIGHQGNDEIIADNDVYGIEDIIPIPLTEEILAKNGFEYAYNGASKMQNKQLLVACIGGHYIEIRLDKRNVAIWYDYDENDSDYYSDVLLELPRTVHQLQHLLRLCGIDKEVVL